MLTIPVLEAERMIAIAMVNMQKMAMALLYFMIEKVRGNVDDRQAAKPVGLSNVPETVKCEMEFMIWKNCKIPYVDSKTEKEIRHKLIVCSDILFSLKNISNKIKESNGRHCSGCVEITLPISNKNMKPMIAIVVMSYLI